MASSPGFGSHPKGFAYIIACACFGILSLSLNPVCPLHLPSPSRLPVLWLLLCFFLLGFPTLSLLRLNLPLQSTCRSIIQKVPRSTSACLLSDLLAFPHGTLLSRWSISFSRFEYGYPFFDLTFLDLLFSVLSRFRSPLLSLLFWSWYYATTMFRFA